MAASGGSFKKGDPRINRGGRPKAKTSASEIIEKMLSVKDYPVKGKEGEFITRKEALFKKLFDLSMNGDTSALKLLIDHGYGRPKQVVEQDIQINQPAEINFTDDVEDDEGK